MENYKVRNNEEIGKYLSDLIEKTGMSMRQFGRKFLKCKGASTDEDDINKMANKLSQIKKGRKGVQLEDLPIFSHLLNVSAEEILTAGHYFYPYKNRFTNYDFAMSKDKNIWKEYIEREDKIILNTDEYGKTVIDYALEFENYPLLKYMMDEGYIWFVGKNPGPLETYFGAGTSIERKPIYEIDSLDTKLKYEDNLRLQMIRLAIKNKDFKMMEELHGRELPSLYLSGYANYSTLGNHDRYSELLIETIADADDKVIEYFTEEFEIETVSHTRTTFIFPYINQLIEKIVTKKTAESVLRRCILHNKNTYCTIKKMFEKMEQCNIAMKMTPEEAKKLALNELKNSSMDYNEEFKIVKILSFNPTCFFTTNLVKIDYKSVDQSKQILIDEVNQWFDKIINCDF